MIKAMLIALMTVACAAPAVANVWEDVRRERTARRPYIVEIGEPYEITPSTVRDEARRISQMKTYLSEYGLPDYAEIQEIEPEWPWESYEVRLYYLRRNLELDFGHVFLSEAEPGFGALKFQVYIDPDKRREIESVLAARQMVPEPAAVAESVETTDSLGLSEALVARIEAAAERAAKAAERAAKMSEAAKLAADRTVDVVDRMLEYERGL